LRRHNLDLVSSFSNLSCNENSREDCRCESEYRKSEAVSGNVDIFSRQFEGLSLDRRRYVSVN
jgi:hypothetical protein